MPRNAIILPKEEIIEKYKNWIGVETLAKEYHIKEHPEEREYLKMAKKLSKEEFIRRAQKVHAGEDLDYSEVEYINNRTPVKIIDKEYGAFWQTPTNHLRGHRHPMRKGKRISASKAMSQEEFIARAQEVHKGENLDYSEVEYVNMHTPVKIICRELDADGNEYGAFWQEPASHLKGHTNKHLMRDRQARKEKERNAPVILEKLKALRPDYDFSEAVYDGYRGEMVVICPTHGEFKTTAERLLAGKGCPRCGHSISKSEEEIYNFLLQYFSKEEVVRRDKSVLDGMELDIFIPARNFAIEYNGLRWHSEAFGKGGDYHLKKTEKCAEKGIVLIQIFEDEFLNHKEIVFAKLKRILKLDGILPRAYARKCQVGEITKNDARNFLEKNHIQGFVSSTIYCGAFLNGKLIAVMSFLKEKEGEWNLTRYATDNSLICVGVGGKLFSHFLKDYSPARVKSFADRRWTFDSENNLYIKLGFVLDGIVNPDYRYICGGERKHKFGFRKTILHKTYGLPLSMTEKEMTQELGFDRIWDCGLYRYVWRPSTKTL